MSQTTLSSKSLSATHLRTFKWTLRALYISILLNARINVGGCSPLPILEFHSHSFVPNGLRVSYRVENSISIYYNATALIDFPGKLIFNFFVRRLPAAPGEPSESSIKYRNMDFCKSIEQLKNLTIEQESTGLPFYTTFIHSCPLTQGFYYIANGMFDTKMVPPHLPRGLYWLQFELLQIFDEVTKVLNVRVKSVIYIYHSAAGIRNITDTMTATKLTATTAIPPPTTITRPRRAAIRKAEKPKHLHLQLQLQLQQIVVAAVFGLIFAIICVSGQIDGYEAGVDYPAYEAVPKGLSFNCQGRTPGYYADTETRCQVWHWCLHSGHQYSFLCPNGTVFNQAVRVCDWWTNVNCPGSEQLYENNQELYRTVAPNEQQNI